MNQKLAKYVLNHTVRGACVCGQCCDAPKNPEKYQPEGHTADLIFFKITMAAFPTKKEFTDIVREEFPRWFDGKEHTYTEMGADVGDQGVALMTMGLGSLLGIWTLWTPKTLLPGCSDDEARTLAGMGQISIVCEVGKL